MSIRIGGLASGMDIDQIVTDLMRAERVKVDIVPEDGEEDGADQ
jgi:flagellar hook-associated protein 2